MTAHQREQARPSAVAIDDSLNAVRQALESLRFGAVVLTVHEGRIVQIDVTEKRRLPPA